MKSNADNPALLNQDTVSNVASRKNSVPNYGTGFPYLSLSKLSFSHASKEKKILTLGSPKAIFRSANSKHSQQQEQSKLNTTGSDDNEVFSQITLPMNRVISK